MMSHNDPKKLKKKQANRDRLLFLLAKDRHAPSCLHEMVYAGLISNKKILVACVITLSLLTSQMFSVQAYAKEGRNKSEITIETLSEEEFMGYITALKEGLTTTKDANELLSIYETAYEYLLRKVQNIELMDIEMNLDMTVVYDQYAKENSELRSWSDELYQVMQKLCLMDDYKDAFCEYLGEEEFKRYKEYEPLTDYEDAVFTQIDELQTKVNEIKAIKTVTIKDKEYTLAQLEEANIQGEISESQYYLAYYELCENCYDEIGDLFLELTALRNELASYYEYENYMAYSYEVEYDRDYTYIQAKELREYLCENWVADFWDYEDAILDWQEEIEVDAFTIEEAVPLVKKYLPMIDYTFRESIQYAADHDLWDLDQRGEKVSFSFVQDLSYDGVPFLSIHGVSNLYDLGVFAHELGHYNADFHSSEAYYRNMSNIIDIAEIHSQGAELLFSLYYDAFSQNAAFAQANGIMNVEQLMIYAAMMDAVEYEIYTNPDLTKEDVSKAYVNALNDYYGYSVSADSMYAKEWVLDDVWFSSPCYYISYVVSGFSALNIYTIAAINYETGVHLYKKIIDCDWKYRYLELVNEYKLLNPFEKEHCDFLYEKITEQYDNCLDGEVACSPYIRFLKKK